MAPGAPRLRDMSSTIHPEADPFDLTQMEAGREYMLDELPGFTSDEAEATVADPLASMRRAFARSLCNAVRDKKVASTFLLVPTGARYGDLQDIPDTYGLDDIRVLFWRIA